MSESNLTNTSAPNINALHSKAEYLKAVTYSGLTVLESTASWCSKCAAIAPEVEKMAREYPDVHFFTYDTDECGDIAHELGVSEMPTFSLFKDGDILEGVSGARAAAVRKAIDECLAQK